MKELVFTVLGPFGGGGFGLHGFANARVEMLGRKARFVVLGGIDFDKDACKDFELMTGVPELCADIHELPVSEIRRLWPRRPDVVFTSAPCKAASKLLSDAKAQEPEYQRMMKLALVWTQKMLEAWIDDLPPLVLFENVPNIVTARRGKEIIAGVRKMLRNAGYLVADGFHDCGELGGMAQHRKRYLMVGRRPDKVPQILYQPPKKRVRGCGEVLRDLPLPEDVEAGGPMHTMPRISMLNWLRLALIPPGGDWRDIPGVLEGRQRRTIFRRYRLEDWKQPSSTIGGSGTNGPYGINDPRVNQAIAVSGDRFHHAHKVTSWASPTPTVTSSPAPSSGAISVADPRLPENPNRHLHKYAVRGFDQPMKTVTGDVQPGNGGQSVADPRVGRAYKGAYGVVDWASATGTVTGEAAVSTGSFSVADPRLDSEARRAWEREGKKTPGGIHWFKGKYGVVGWDKPARTVIGGPGSNFVADPRLNLGAHAHTNILRVTSWTLPTGTVTGAVRPSSGAISVADPRLGCAPHAGAYGVVAWGEPIPTVTSHHKVDNRPASVADPILVRTAFDHGYGVLDWAQPSPTVAAGSHPGQGSYSVADPQIRKAFRGAHGVCAWDEPSGVVTGNARPSTGRFSVADPHISKGTFHGAYGVLGWGEPSGVVIGSARPSSGSFSVADPRLEDYGPELDLYDGPMDKAPPFIPLIIADDGTWHRPLTTLELAALQSIPVRINGQPLVLAGSGATKWRETIGNAVPPLAAQAIAERYLVALTCADAQSFMLSGGGKVWVDAPDALEPGWAQLSM